MSKSNILLWTPFAILIIGISTIFVGVILDFGLTILGVSINTTQSEISLLVISFALVMAGVFLLALIYYLVDLVIQKIESATQTWRFSNAYYLQPKLLTDNEASFYRVLLLALNDRYTVFAKVRLGDLFDANPGSNEVNNRQMIDKKHVDFVICDKQSLQPLLGIELDDSSHQTVERQQESDEIKNTVFYNCGLPLLRVTSHRQYNPKLLADKIKSLAESEKRSIIETLN